MGQQHRHKSQRHIDEGEHGQQGDTGDYVRIQDRDVVQRQRPFGPGPHIGDSVGGKVLSP